MNARVRLILTRIMSSALAVGGSRKTSSIMAAAVAGLLAGIAAPQVASAYSRCTTVEDCDELAAECIGDNADFQCHGHDKSNGACNNGTCRGA